MTAIDTSSAAVDDRRVLGQIRAIRHSTPGHEIEVATDYGDVFMPLESATSARIRPGAQVWLSLWHSPASIELSQRAKSPS